MEATERMVNEEVVEEVVETAAEEIVNDSHKGLKIAAGTGAAIILGVIAVKFIVKPAIAKIKAKKENDDVIDAKFEEVDNNNENVTGEDSAEEN